MQHATPAGFHFALMPALFRFAPSPNGALHLGHALSALLNFEAAKQTGGRFLLRIEDIDTVRCSEDKIEQMLDDLDWLGIRWEEPVMRQSKRFSFYEESLKSLKDKGLLYPSQASRKEIQIAVKEWETASEAPWPRDPDGAVHYPRAMLIEREKDEGEAAWRLDMKKALESHPSRLFWQETGPFAPSYPQGAQIEATPHHWGDVILARKDCPTSYHLSVVLDDAAQGITHIVRGQDLYAATSLHKLLQTIFGLPAPLYHHHRLLTDIGGQKLSKSRQSLSLKALRKDGVTPAEIKKLIRWSDADLKAFTPA
ncbi:tRNA glutamyl-Q(34) synthetase GluQRS [uncultured Cohaesibacter sp.]|uniref:tRNA glutamyl-Q(34) synthetase GluQRS n=1 Tax=uncultured Cohaesibacter sp. TaxID=1002546 RepID=UPI002AA77DCB|nr:tRNA glutamyl-Q(34) synthetase GluQRS [uncultured Cohaesibacter sp.]